MPRLIAWVAKVCRSLCGWMRATGRSGVIAVVTNRWATLRVSPVVRPRTLALASRGRRVLTSLVVLALLAFLIEALAGAHHRMATSEVH
jgi:hypothetical protein